MVVVVVPILLLIYLLSWEWKKIAWVRRKEAKIAFSDFFSLQKTFLDEESNSPNVWRLAKKFSLHQRSQTRGPREGPKRPSNIRKNGGFKRNMKPIGLFSQKHSKLLTQKKFVFSFFYCFQSHVARETLWVWDPWFVCQKEHHKRYTGNTCSNYNGEIDNRMELFTMR